MPDLIHGNAMSAVDTVRSVARGETSPRDVLALAMTRIESTDGALKAFVRLADRDEILAELPALPGRLQGLPVAIKDNFDTASLSTAYGSAVYRGHKPVIDAAVVAALKQAGAMVVGKTATTEFAAWPAAATVNPHDPSHTPGGSSAGSAASVAAGLVPVAFGTQTLGSVIRPASFCGIVGFKPSRGRISTVGIKALSESLDTVGLFARSVADVRLVYGVLAASSEELPPDASPIRLAYCRDANWDKADADARDAFLSTVALLKQKGLSIDELPLPEGFGEVTRLGRLVHDYEMRRALLPEMRLAPDLVSPSMRAGIERAAGISAGQHAEAFAEIAAQGERLTPLLAPYDALLTLAAPGEAPQGHAFTGDAMFNIPWTVLSMPAITLPVMKGARGLPIGLQVVARTFEEACLLHVAERLEGVLGEKGNAKVA